MSDQKILTLEELEKIKGFEPIMLTESEEAGIFELTERGWKVSESGRATIYHNGGLIQASIECAIRMQSSWDLKSLLIELENHENLLSTERENSSLWKRSYDELCSWLNGEHPSPYLGNPKYIADKFLESHRALAADRAPAGRKGKGYPLDAPSPTTIRGEAMSIEQAKALADYYEANEEPLAARCIRAEIQRAEAGDEAAQRAITGEPQ